MTATSTNGAVQLPVYKPKDFASDAAVRWCPGCGDYAVLTAMRQALAKLPHKKEDYVFVSGIGCAARFPYYMATYGLHTIHGRALPVATGLKVTRPELQVIVVSGDGDLISIGGGHLVHALRRNVDMTVVLLNNRVYGLTKGQYSPTSQPGMVTPSTPEGSLDTPVHPLALAIASGATFVARCLDVDVKGLASLVVEANQHPGTAIIEVYQDCNIFNHKAWFYASQKETKDENTVALSHGEPLVFGGDGQRAVCRVNERLGVGGAGDANVVTHDETNRALAYELSLMTHADGMPEVMGVLYRDANAPVYEQQIREVQGKSEPALGDDELAKLIRGRDAWDVPA